MTRAILSVCVVLGLAGCPGGDHVAVPDATPCDLEVEWGVTGDAGFEPFVTGANAELTLGFQGFRYVASTLRLMLAEPGDLAQVTFQIELEGQEPYAVAAAHSVPAPASDGAHYLPNVLVFFNDVPIPQLVGRAATITTRVVVGACRGSYAARVTIVDEEDCVEQPDGGLVCE